MADRKPVKVLTDLLTRKQIIKTDEANNIVFNVSSSNGTGHVSSSLPISASDAYFANSLTVDGILRAEEIQVTKTISSLEYETSISASINALLDVSASNANINQFLKWDGSKWVPGNATSITVGTNLTGNDTGGTVTVSLADNIILTSVTASLYGTSSYSLNAATASYVTASNIDNFTTDVQSQFNAGANLTYATGTYALNNNISLNSVTASFSGNGAGITGVVSASYATTASYAENTSFDVTGIQNAYKRLRYQEVGYFTHGGDATIQLPTSSYGGASFPTESLNYINVNATVLDNGNWVNDIFAVTTYISASKICIDLWAPDLHQTDQYKILVINEDPNYFII